MQLSLSEIDFEHPKFVIDHYYITGCIAIVMNSLVFYLLIFQSGRMDSFKYYMMSFQAACSLVDIHLSFVMQPIPLFPIRGGYVAGYIPNVFQLTPHLMMAILSVLVGFQVNTLNLCFLRKHQAIAKIDRKYILSKPVYNLLVSFFLTYTFTYTVNFWFAHVPKDEQFKIIDREYSIFRKKFEEMNNFDVYELNYCLIAFVLFIVAGCVQSTIFVSLLVLNMFQTLSKCSTSLSKSTLEKHKTALKSLVAQFMTTPVAILPAMLIVVPLLVYSPDAQVFTWYCLMVMTIHSTINSIVVIVTLPEFRGFVIFWSDAGKRRRRLSTRLTAVSNLSSSFRPSQQF